MTSDRDHDEWRPCAAGDLQRYRQSLPASRRAAQVTPWLAVAFTAALVTVTWWGVRSTFISPEPLPASPSRPVNLTCVEVIGLLPEYRNGQLDAEIKERVSQHLAKCPSCRSALDNLASARQHHSAAFSLLLARVAADSR